MTNDENVDISVKEVLGRVWKEGTKSTYWQHVVCLFAQITTISAILSDRQCSRSLILLRLNSCLYRTCNYSNRTTSPTSSLQVLIFEGSGFLSAFCCTSVSSCPLKNLFFFCHLTALKMSSLHLHRVFIPLHCAACKSRGRYYEHSLNLLRASNLTKWLRRSCASIMSITKCY